MLSEFGFIGFRDSWIEDAIDSAKPTIKICSILNDNQSMNP